MNAFSPSMPRPKRRNQLLLPGLLFVVLYAASLMLAPSVRQHLPQPQPQWEYLLPLGAWLALSIVLQRYIHQHLPNADPWIYPIIATLSGWGILTVWRLSPSLGARQALWYSLGSAIMLLGLKQPLLVSSLRRYKYLWLGLGLLLIGLTFLIGVNPAGQGPKLWLRFFDFYLQPSEPLKLLMIIYLAAYFADQIRPRISLLQAILPSLLVMGIAGLLLVAQRDLGAASLFVVLYALMLTVTTQRRQFLIALPVIAIITGGLAYLASDLVRSRIDIWLNPWLESSGASYQLVQAQIAIAAGGLTGTGPGLGSPGFVPVAVSDFIFSALAEEGGLLFTGAYLFLILLLAIRGLNTAQNGKTAFGRYLAFGLTSYFFLQAVFIVGGNLSLLPLTGVTMPFMSYGGSSLVTNLFAAMLLLRLSTEPSAAPAYDRSRRVYRFISASFIALFAVALLANTYIAFFRQRELLAVPENPRWAVYDRYSPRGQIFAQDGEPLVTTTGTPGSFNRHTVYPPLSNMLGYASARYGQTGLESTLYNVLRGYSGTNYAELWWHQRLFNQPLPGLDLRLNIDLTLQQHADALLNGHKGAIISMNAATGEVYTLSSYPGFDANRLDETWQELMARADAPLLNRATQGSYPLGPASSLIGLADYFGRPENPRDLPDLNTALDTACRQAMITGQRNDPALAVKYGCLAASEGLVARGEPKAIAGLTQAFGLLTAPNVAIQTAAAQTLPTDISQGAAMAQALTSLRVSPLQLALLTAAISNDGNLPSAQIVNAYRDPQGNWQPFAANASATTPVISPMAARKIQSTLQDGTQPLWFTSGQGSAAGEGGLAWYLGGTTSAWTGTPLTVVVILEENNARLAQNIGHNLLTAPTRGIQP